MLLPVLTCAQSSWSQELSRTLLLTSQLDIHPEQHNQLLTKIPIENLNNFQLQILFDSSPASVLYLLFISLQLGVLLVALYQLVFYLFARNNNQASLAINFIGWGLYLIGLAPLASKSLGYPTLVFYKEESVFILGICGALLLLYMAMKNPKKESVKKYLHPLILGMMAFFAFTLVAYFVWSEINYPQVTNKIIHLIFSLLLAVSFLSSAYFINKKSSPKQKPYHIDWLPNLGLGIGWSIALLAPLFWASEYQNFLPSNNGFYLANIAFVLCSPLMIVQNSILLSKMQHQQSQAMKHIRIGKEKISRITNTTNKLIPKQFLELLSKKEITEIQNGEAVKRDLTIMFSDIRSFTSRSALMSPEESFEFLNNYFGRLGKVVYRHNGFIDKFIGDAIMAVFCGKPDDAVECAILIQRWIRLYNNFRRDKSSASISTGVGINSGSTMIGILGTGNRMDSTVVSDAVNLAFHVETLTRNYNTTVLITENTYKKLKNPQQYSMRHLDLTSIKGHEKKLDIYEVISADHPEIRKKKISITPYYEDALRFMQTGNYEKALITFRLCQARYQEDYPTILQINRCLEIIQAQKDASHSKIYTTPPVQIDPTGVNPKETKLSK